MNVSPVTTHYYEDVPDFLGLVLQMFSIIGGLFMVAKVLDQYLSNFWAPKGEDREEYGNVELERHQDGGILMAD